MTPPPPPLPEEPPPADPDGDYTAEEWARILDAREDAEARRVARARAAEAAWLRPPQMDEDEYEAQRELDREMEREGR